MATAHAPVSDMLVTVKSRELQRGLLAEMRSDRTSATRHFLAAAHLELVLADDYSQASQADLAFRSHLSAASCFWRAGRSDQAREFLATLMQEHATQKPAIQQIIAELEHNYPPIDPERLEFQRAFFGSVSGVSPGVPQHHRPNEEIYMSIHMVIELPERSSAQTVAQALEAYKVRLRAGIARTKRRLATFETRYGVDTAHFLHEMTAEDLPGGDLEYVEWAGEAKLLEGLEAELRELEHASYHLP